MGHGCFPQAAARAAQAQEAQEMTSPQDEESQGADAGSLQAQPVAAPLI